MVIQVGQGMTVGLGDGVVTNHLFDHGALAGVSGPTTLATIMQTSPLYIYFTTSEPQVLAIQRRLANDLAEIPVEIGLQDEEGYPHKGDLNYASPEVNMATGTLTAAPGFSSDQAIDIMDQIGKQILPAGTAYQWTAMSYQD
jgi:membrane fusion protein, multidrug efflux system